VLRPIFWFLWRVKIFGQENIPKRGGVLLALNHLSTIDPPVAGAFIKRPVHAMAKEELFRVPFLGSFIRATDAFPVRRRSFDIRAIRFALKLLARGEGVAIFIEGGRSKDGDFGRALPGAGMLACLSQVPVIPIRIRNSDRRKKHEPITITVGKPVIPPKEYSKQDYQRFSEYLLEKVKKL
jgi:1-acyl-sn-glycerol-3-phosphate acyltransferase